MSTNSSRFVQRGSSATLVLFFFDLKCCFKVSSYSPELVISVSSILLFQAHLVPTKSC